MITFLEGKLENRQPTHIEINVGGVGYEVFIPLSSYNRLPREGGTFRILTYHHVTDSNQKLFGFYTIEEREMFVLLLSVSGIGPRLALSALSGLSVEELRTALACGDTAHISSISGVGKKTAERIVIELRDRFNSGKRSAPFVADGVVVSGDSRIRDAALALNALGHNPADALRIIRGAARELAPETTVEELIRRALSK